MDYLADTNVLLRSTHQTHPMHPAAMNALTTLLHSGDRVCVTPQDIIVAAMNIYGITHLLSFIGPDFKRYSGIRVLHPIDVVKPANP